MFDMKMREDEGMLERVSGHRAHSQSQMFMFSLTEVISSIRKGLFNIKYSFL